MTPAEKRKRVIIEKYDGYIWPAQMTPAEKRKRTILETYGSFSVIAQKTRDTIHERHGDDFYERIGRKGGETVTGKPRGFGLDPAQASVHGKKGAEVAHTKRRLAKIEDTAEETGG